MKKVAVVFGTRPEAIKMCPLVLELKKRHGIQTVVCVTGQHRQMLDSVLEVFDVHPDYDLNIMKENQTLFEVTVLVMTRMKEVLEKERPDVVLVHGDTTTAYASALAGFYLRIPVGHVEAGLRTYNIFSPFPEEMNRRSIGIMACLLYTSKSAVWQVRYGACYSKVRYPSSGGNLLLYFSGIELYLSLIHIWNQMH